MYLRGLAQDTGYDLYPIGDFGSDVETNPAPPDIMGPVDNLPAPSNTGPTQSFDWTGLLKTAMQTYGTVTTQKAAIAASQPRLVNASAPLPARSVSSPFTGGLASTGGLLTLAAFGVGLWFLVKKRK